MSTACILFSLPPQSCPRPHASLYLAVLEDATSHTSRSPTPREIRQGMGAPLGASLQSLCKKSAQAARCAEVAAAQAARRGAPSPRATGAGLCGRVPLALTRAPCLPRGRRMRTIGRTRPSPPSLRKMSCGDSTLRCPLRARARPWLLCRSVCVCPLTSADAVRVCPAPDKSCLFVLPRAHKAFCVLPEATIDAEYRFSQ